MRKALLNPRLPLRLSLNLALTFSRSFSLQHSINSPSSLGEQTTMVSEGGPRNFKTQSE